jgi:hypothetical protein
MSNREELLANYILKSCAKPFNSAWVIKRDFPEFGETYHLSRSIFSTSFLSLSNLSPYRPERSIILESHIQVTPHCEAPVAKMMADLFITYSI